jgi:hypothetical protein
MRRFHISDVLTITTGRLVSTRHMDGVYGILNYMTGDNLFTYQLPRASRECSPVLCALYPGLSEEALSEPLKKMAEIAAMEGDSKETREASIAIWLTDLIASVGPSLPLDEQNTLLVPTLKDHQHTRINPIQELEAMVGKDRVVVVEVGKE